MKIHDSVSKFGIVTKIFHWFAIVLVVNQYISINYFKYLPKSDPLKHFVLVAWHKPAGFILFFIAILFIIWRFQEQQRPSLNNIPLYEKIAAKSTHMALFILLFFQPLSGILMSNASGYSINFFGTSLPMMVAKNKVLADFMHDAHHLLGGMMFLLILVHSAAALKHRFWDKDGILKRMF
jgi:cytochrome b561